MNSLGTENGDDGKVVKCLYVHYLYSVDTVYSDESIIIGFQPFLY